MMVCVEASDSLDLMDCIDFSDLADAALIGWSEEYWYSMDEGDSGMMSFGRIAMGVGLGAEGVGMLKLSEPGECEEPVATRSGMAMGGALRRFVVSDRRLSGSLGGGGTEVAELKSGAL